MLVCSCLSLQPGYRGRLVECPHRNCAHGLLGTWVCSVHTAARARAHTNTHTHTHTQPHARTHTRTHTHTCCIAATGPPPPPSPLNTHSAAAIGQSSGLTRSCTHTRMHSHVRPSPQHTQRRRHRPKLGAQTEPHESRRRPVWDRGSASRQLGFESAQAAAPPCTRRAGRAPEFGCTAHLPDRWRHGKWAVRDRWWWWWWWLGWAGRWWWYERGCERARERAARAPWWCCAWPPHGPSGAAPLRVCVS